jgi:carboxypeptidase Q
LSFRIAAAALLSGLTVLSASAQTSPPATADSIIQRELASSKAYDTLAYLTDNIGQRLSGSKSAAAAVTWTTSQFRQWGIDVKNEPVTVPHWVRGMETGALVSHFDQKIVLTALGGSVATPDDGITAEVVEVHNYDELTALGRDKIAGKIVLYDVPMNLDLVRNGHAFEAYRDAVVYRGSGASRAAELGAVASLIRSVASASLRTPHTGSVRYDAKIPVKIPAAAITTEDAGLIHRLIAKGETVRMHLVLTPKTLPDVESFNVVAEIKGHEKPDEIVLIGGHLDSWDLGTGAIDDGSGVAMVMETMRLLKEMKVVPRRTIRCVLFMNEENGLAGGKAYAAAHQGELAKHIAAIETDAGVAMPAGYRTTLAGDPLTRFAAELAPLAAASANHLETAKETGADTGPLVTAGVPGFGFAPNGLHYFDYHHTPADTLDKVDPKELAANTAAIAALAWTIAEREGSLR